VISDEIDKVPGMGDGRVSRAFGSVQRRDGELPVINAGVQAEFRRAENQSR
jgi:hypothetical protein